jgi:hypothetical protein
MAISLQDGRYLRGYRLGLSDPSDLVVSDAGFVAVCFNGPDSHIVVVLDQNLNFISRRSFDGCVQCWAPADCSGIDHLVVSLKWRGVKLVRLPLIDDVRPLRVDIGFEPEFLACSKGECFAASTEGNVTHFPIRAA